MQTVSDHDALDATASEIATAVLAGELDEHTARCRLAGLVMASGVIEDVAAKKPGLAPQQRADLAENLTDLVVARKILQPGSQFDLSRMQTESLCGYARSLARKAAGFDQAVRPRWMLGRTELVDPMPPAVTDGAGPAAYQYHVAAAFDGLSAEDMALADWSPETAETAVEVAEEVMAFSRKGESRDRAQARALRQALRLPALCLPEDPEERARMLVAVGDDPQLAYRSLVQMAAMVLREPPAVPCGVTVDSPAGEEWWSLWDDFSPDHLETVLVRPVDAARVLVVDALSLAPKPSRAAARTLAREVRAASAERGWAAAQEGLVAAFLALTTEPVSLFDDTNDESAKAQKIAAARAAAERWPSVVGRVVSFNGAPLGSSAREVAEALGGMLEAAAVADEANRIRARRGRRAA